MIYKCVLFLLCISNALSVTSKDHKEILLKTCYYENDIGKTTAEKTLDESDYNNPTYKIIYKCFLKTYDAITSDGSILADKLIENMSRSKIFQYAAHICQCGLVEDDDILNKVAKFARCTRNKRYEFLE